MAETLLAADEPVPVTVRHEEGSSPFMLVADHAGNNMPRALGRLGLDAADCERHIAWDIGIAGLGPRPGRRARCDADPTKLFAAGDRLQPAA